MDNRLVITPEKVELYAAMSEDFNAIHLDSEFAKRTEFGQTVAHGTIGAAHMVRCLVAQFGESALRSLEVKYIAPVATADTLTCEIQPGTTDAGTASSRATEENVWVGVRRSDGTLVAVGTAVVRAQDVK